MSKILIVYGTRSGSTKKSAEVMAKTLKEEFSGDVDITDVKQIKKYINDLARYDSFIVGSSIMAGQWTGRTKKFLKNPGLANKKVALFVSAGGVFKEAYDSGKDKTEAVKKAVSEYIDPHLAEWSISPLAKGAFGGKMVFFGKEKLNTWKAEDAADWIREIHQILSS